MTYPAPSDYQDALQTPRLALADPALAGGEVAAGPLGLPRLITGAFAVVFRIETPAGPYALRCFLADVPDRRARYRAIARRLAEGPVPGFLPFEYLPEGVRVGRTAYPAVKMPWVEGAALDAFVAAHLREPDTLRALAEAWRGLLGDLREAGVAHGDLQHGNVLVARGEGGLTLALVDYDAVFVPALAGRTSAEVGHRNYQHPDRTEADFDEGIDRFPGLVVYTALLALAERPDLWDRFSTGENLLFQATDFYDPAGSELWGELRGIEVVGPLAEALARACHLPPARVPDLEGVLAGDLPEEGETRRGPRPGEASRPPKRGRAERWALPAVGGAAVVTVLLAVGGAPGAALVWSVIATGVFVGLTLRGQARLSPVRRRRRLQREAAVLAQWVADLEDERRALAAEREGLAGHRERLRAERLRELQDEVLERGLRHHFTGELSEVEGVGHGAVVRLKVVRIRNAFHATPERVAEARGLTSDQRERIGAWRAGLVERYAGEVPDALSPAEEQRMARLFERRLEAFDADGLRVRQKQAVQEAELAKVRAQLEATPEVSPLRYAAHLLGLRALPETPALREATPAPAPRFPEAPEGPWWSDPSA